LEATPVTDYLGPELTSTTINGVTRAALRFDGTDSWLESSGSINVPPEGSMALVMNLTGPSPDVYTNRPVGWEDPSQGPTGFAILATTPGAGLLVVARGIGIGDVSLEPSLGADYEIVVATWGAGGTTLSRTSTANVTAQAVNPAPGTILPSPGVSTLHIGGSGLQPVGRPNLWSGDILQVQAYDNQLSAEEITSLTASLYERWFAAPPAGPGDYNGNGTVDAADYVVWRKTLGSTTDLAADGNNNQEIDDGDYTVWAQNFGNGGGGGTILASIPEPSTWLLCLGTLLVSVAVRRSRRSAN
jgi:hypothetical protein